MADILYEYGNAVYANLTNQCCCRCTFCIRNTGDGLGSARTLWHEKEPGWPEVKAAVDRFDFAGFRELVFCGYGEPTCALELLLQTAAYMKVLYPHMKLRLNTNGLGNLVSKKDIVPLLAPHIDSVSVSLNAPDSEAYDKLCRPDFDNAFAAVLDFAEKALRQIGQVKFSVVDVISEEQSEACRKLANDMGIPLRVRACGS